MHYQIILQFLVIEFLQLKQYTQQKGSVMNTTDKIWNLSSHTFVNGSDKNVGTIRSIYITLMMTIVSFGFLGNALILVVMCNKSFSKTSTSVYLSVLAVSDSLMLFAGPLAVNVFPTDMSLKIDLRTVHLSTCWILKILIYWARYFSSFCLASITVERMIVILKPHR